MEISESALRALIDATVERAMERVRVPRVLPGRVESVTDATTASVTVDGDRALTSMGSLAPGLEAGERVMVLFYPPAGALVLGRVNEAPWLEAIVANEECCAENAAAITGNQVAIFGNASNINDLSAWDARAASEVCILGVDITGSVRVCRTPVSAADWMVTCSGTVSNQTGAALATGQFVVGIPFGYRPNDVGEGRLQGYTRQVAVDPVTIELNVDATSGIGSLSSISDAKWANNIQCKFVGTWLSDGS